MDLIMMDKDNAIIGLKTGGSTETSSIKETKGSPDQEGLCSASESLIVQI